MTGLLRSRRARVAAACVLQAALVVAAVAPQLSARLTGADYRLAVAPLDPVDPFRGAYVTLGYPGLPALQSEQRPLPSGTVFLPLERVPGGELWEGAALTVRQPAEGPFLRCAPEGWRARCGIESLFSSQDEARRMERQLVNGAVAVVRIDDRGNAALLRVEFAGP